MKAVVLAALICASALAAYAQGLQLAPADNAPAAKPAGDGVVARVNGEPIGREEVMAALAGMMEELQGVPPQMMLQAATERAIESRLLDGAAAKSDVRNSEQFKKQLADIEVRLARQVYLQRWLAEKVTDKELQAAYDATYPGGKGERQVHARHILVKTKPEADKVIADLGKGAAFEKLASERTIDPSGKTTGGDLGFFGEGQMVPAFEKAAFGMKPGEVTKQPVESQFGWHVIKVEAEKTEPAPSFEQAKPELRERASQQLLGQLFADLKKDAKIEYATPADPAAKK